MQTKQHHRLLALLMTIVTIFQFVIISPDVVFAEETEVNASTGSTLSEESNVASSEENPVKATKTGTVLAFTSDVHNKSSNESANRMSSWIDIVESKHGSIDAMAFGGDMGYAGASGYWDLVKADMNVLTNKGVTGVYTTGNHEISMGGDFKYSSYISNSYSATEPKGQFSIDKEVISGDYYRIYCLGSHNSSSSYADQINSLATYLNDAGNDKVIFVITHFPLHYCSSRTTSNASDIIDVLNDAVTNNDQTIVFLWGHNHTMSDTYYDQIYGPGGVDSIQYTSSSNSKKTIKFYYGAAGCMSDSENGTGSAYVKGKGLVVAFNDADGTMMLTYYNAEGKDVTESNSVKSVSVDLADPIPATGVTINGETVTGDDGQPVVVESVSAGNTLQLDFTLEPENASSSGITWSSSNESVATVNNKGLVTAKSEGKTTITAAIPSNTKAARTSSIEITVTAAEVEPKTVDITPTSSSSPSISETINAGETLIINVKNGSSSSAYNYTATLSNSGIAEIQGNATVNIAAGGTGQIVVKGLANGTVDIDIQNDGSYSTRKGTIHLTVGDGDVPPTGDETVEITPTTDNPEESVSIKVDETLVINVINSSTNSGYDYTATLSNSGIAEFQGNATINIAKGGTGYFIVKGLANGTVDITIQNNNTTGSQYTRKGVIHLTVGEGSTPIDPPVGETVTYELVTDFENGGEYLIVNSNEVGSAYALKNLGTSVTDIANSDYKMAVTIKAGSPVYIEVADSSIVWTAEASGSGFHLSNSGLFLEGKSGHTGLYDTLNNSDRAWTYSNSNQLQMPGSPSGGQNTTYTLRYSSSNKYFQGDSSTGSNTYRVYIFKKVGTDPVSAVTLSPEALALETGETATLTATVSPSSAGNKNVAWSSNNEAIATVDSNGVVTAVSAGNATITVTTVDGNKTATCDVTVTAAVTVEYELADTLEAGKKYLIATSNNGAGFILSNEAGTVSNSLKGYAVNVVNGKLTINKSVELKTLFNCEQNTNSTDPNYTRITKDNKYLYADNGGALRLADSISDNGKNWHYKAADKYVLWFYNGTNGDYGYTATDVQKYYLQYDSNGNFTKGIVSNANTVSGTNTPKIYLFVEATSVSHEHNYGEPVWSWADDHGSATATFTCECGETQTVTDNNPIEVLVSEATCIEYKKVKYTATVELNGVEYTTTSEDIYVEGTLIGHKYRTDSGSLDWKWSNYEAATAHFVCSVCNHLEYVTDDSPEETLVSEATCTSDRVVKYTATVTFEGITVTDTTENVTLYGTATGHAWAEITYTWNADNSQVTALKACNNDHTHDITETVSTTSTVTAQPTCEGKGKTTYTATFTNAAFETQTKEVEDVPALGHAWAEITYTWNADNSQVTALKACNNDHAHDITETVSTTSAVTVQPTCEGKGKTTYTATFSNATFETQTKEVEDVTALGHAWAEITYTWNADNSQVTALKACNNDHTHDITETVATTYAVIVDATETTAGVGRYTSKPFENDAFTVQTKDVEIPPTGYEVSYIWADDNSFVTGTAVPLAQGADTITEIVNTTSAVTVQPTCEGKGKTTYTATFSNVAFTTQTKEVEDVPALGHDWAEVIYSWSDDNSKVTALKACNNDHAHDITEEVSTTSEVTVPATCEGKGKTTYTATFSNAAFTTQTKEVEDVPALGHDWAEVIYSWSDDNSKVTALKACNNDHTHDITEEVSTTSEVTTLATCEDKGTTTYTAKFTNAEFETQTKSVQNIEALGHDWEFVDISWTEAASGYTAVANYKCSHNEEHTKTVDAAVTSQTTAATCETAGRTVYTATVAATEDPKGQARTADKTVEIEALGHDWEFVDISWTETTNGYTAVANYKCSHNEEHTKTVDAAVTSQTMAATCETAGRTVYTATVAATEDPKGQARTADKTVEIEALGHDWEFVDISWTEAASGYTAVANYKCSHNEEHIQTVAATVTSVTTDATCETAGKIVYTATVTAAVSLDKEAHSDSKTVAIAALGHDWDEPTYTWSTDHTSVTAHFVCKTDTRHVQDKVITENITSKVTTEPTATQEGVKTYTVTFTFDGESYTATATETIPALGTAFGGTVKSFGSEEGETTLTLSRDGVVVKTITVTGNDTTYRFENVSVGIYTLTVSKLNHATRTYTDVGVGVETAGPDVEIKLLGDLNGDGKVTTFDAARVNSHARGVSLLSGYDLVVADVLGPDGGPDGQVTTADAGRINTHARKIRLLWEE